MGDMSKIRLVGLLVGPLAALLLVLSPAPDGLSAAGWQVVALMCWMAIWWATEAIAVPATSLVPLIALPMAGILSGKAAAAPYAHPVIFLLLGGFIAAMAMQRWGLHKRIALNILRRAGDRPTRLIAGFMIASAVLSMWISNTATTLMMLPIALSVAETLLGADHKGHRFTIAIFIGVAWSASIGGLGTIIGTPPNAFVVAFLAEQQGREISFLGWMGFALPVVIAMVPMAWLVLTRISYPMHDLQISGGQNVVQGELAKLGRINTAEARVAMVFAAMAIAWIGLNIWKTLPGLAGLSNTVVAIAGAVAMFLIPAGTGDGEKLLDWDTAERLPWGVLLLFGGGLALAEAIKVTGLAQFIGTQLAAFGALHMIILMLMIVAVVIFLTELTSNTATTAALVPVLASVAAASNFDPLLLAAPTAMAASCAFMLPVATAPNAVIYASKQVTIPQLARAGLWLNIIGIFIITGICYMLVPLLIAA